MDKQGINPNDQEHIDLFLENPDNRELYNLAQFTQEEEHFETHGVMQLDEFKEEKIAHVVCLFSHGNHDVLKSSY